VTKWLLLAGAIGSEVTGSLSLRAGLDHPGWYGLTVAGYLVSFLFLAAVLRTGMPVGVAYGIWGALGVALTATAAAVLFDEALGGVALIGMGLVIVGVIVVEFGSQQATRKLEAA
jgi:small multidrug resistance pump